MIAPLLGVSAYTLANYHVNTKYANFRYNSYAFAMFHAVSASALTVFNVLCLKTRPVHYFDAITPFDHVIVANSVGYFATDLVKCVFAEDHLFTAHHTVALAFILCACFLDTGGSLLSCGLIVGELTNPILHLGWFMKHHKMKHYTTVWKLNTACFGITRVLLSPLLAADVCRSSNNSNSGQIYFCLVCYSLFYTASLFWFVKQLKSYF